jgi:hypothetical protein
MTQKRVKDKFSLFVFAAILEMWMTGRSRARKHLIIVGLFAVAMAYLESSVVVYLRGLYGIENLLLDMPLTPDQYTKIELGREAATLVMLVTIGWLAGRRWQDRIGYTLFTFGLWDIFYYAWLAIFIGWPRSLLDWDLLFLIPLPWWGPVISPMLIALLLTVIGGFAVLKAEKGETLCLTLIDCLVGCAGVFLALYVFMSAGIHALPGGIEALSNARPISFNWSLFFVALMFMGFLVWRIMKPNRIN